MSSKKPLQKIAEPKIKPVVNTPKPIQFFAPQAHVQSNSTPQPTTFYQPQSKIQAKIQVASDQQKPPAPAPVIFHAPQAHPNPPQSNTLHQPHKMMAAPQIKLRTFAKLHSEVSLNQLTSNRSWFYANEITSIYNFPTPYLSRKVTVGVISFGGGLYGKVSPSGILTNGDVQAYWTKCGIPANNHPTVVIVPLLGAVNAPSDSGTDENTLDVEMIGAGCPSPNLTIILYLAPNAIDNFQPLIHSAITTPVSVNGQSLTPTILSVSWAASEMYSYGTLETTLASAAAKGINICVASGDNGSSDGSGNSTTCNYPSSSPNVIACGGTSLKCPSLTYDGSTIETTWSGSGGGISKIYGKPSYQSSLSGNHRKIPDISLNADPNTGISILLGGSYAVYGGTSFVAPLIAGYLATINASTFINPLLYTAPYGTCFHDIVSGSNGSYSAKVGYDDCTGLGSINGTSLAQWLMPSALPVIHVTNVSISPPSSTIPVSQTQQLSVIVSPSDATNQSITWSSLNSSIASVSSSGLVTGLAAGSTAIIATSIDGEFKGASNVTVPLSTVPVSSIGLSTSSITLNVNQTYQASAVVLPSNATNTTVTWSSSNSMYASVSSSGLITAVSAGTVTITATTVDGSKTATMSINVNVPVASVGITPSSTTLAVNQTYQVSAVVLPANATNKAVTWSSSNAVVASVSSSGLITAVSAGTVTITATTVDGSKTATVSVNVNVPVASVSITPSSSKTLSVNQTYQVSAGVLPSNATNKAVTWSSSNAVVASVSASGLVTALSTGNSNITATTVSGSKIATVSVNVNVPVASVSITPSSSKTLSVNQTYQVSAGVLPANATNKAVTWSSSNAVVASVSASGLVKALSAGNTIIAATTVDGSKTSSLNIQVILASVAVTSITSLPGSVSLIIDQTSQLTCAVVPSNSSNTQIKWSSSNSSIASVSLNGLVKGLSPGKSTITATCGGQTTMSAVTVTAPATASVSSKCCIIPHLTVSVNTNVGRTCPLKVSNPDIEHTMVVKSYMKYGL
uniref:Peptidase S53 domain-containing protein n=1 Tax=viral metagenome TaxID=1070528 RepID=A0A6C0KGJ5_9ZZZZ